MIIEITTNKIIEKVEVYKIIGENVEFKINKDDQLKIIKWLSEIRGNGEGIDTMHFPMLKYRYDVSGDVGYIFKIKELITGKELDLTNIDKF